MSARFSQLRAAYMPCGSADFARQERAFDPVARTLYCRIKQTANKMHQAVAASSSVDGELSVPSATVQLITFQLNEPVSFLLQDPEVYRFDLCLTPRPANARIRYVKHWSPNRFERLGEVFVLPSHETVEARSERGRQTSLICRLNTHSGLPDDLPWTEPRLSASVDIAYASIRSLLRRLADELQSPGFASALLVELIAAQLAIELQRYCASLGEEPRKGGLSPWRLRLIDERLHDTGDPPSLTELATLCKLSVRQLTRGFRVSRNCSIGDYVTAARLEHAKQLLTHGQSVQSVASTLGFASASSFCFAFRRATGHTPNSFRLLMNAGS